MLIRFGDSSMVAFLLCFSAFCAFFAGIDEHHITYCCCSVVVLETFSASFGAFLLADWLLCRPKRRHRCSSSRTQDNERSPCMTCISRVLFVPSCVMFRRRTGPRCLCMVRRSSKPVLSFVSPFLSLCVVYYNRRRRFCANIVH